VFWIGAGILVVGIVLFRYSYSTIQNISAAYPRGIPYTLPETKQKLDLAQMLQPTGLGLLALGTTVIVYSVFMKK